ncbi:MAG: winged helix-turn-helix transcriptional regulator [Acidobacteria bacterium]|nr:winged helix-turn-helix transcriptional regulator [Acidobacteriota bacterium]
MNPTPMDLDRELYECHADLCKVLSHPARLRILNTLRKKERSVTELARRLRLGIGNLSQHLNMMKQRRVLVSRKEGNTVFYRLDNPKMLKAFDLIREILLEQMQRESLLVRHIERAQSGSPAATLSRRREKARQHG